MHDGLWEVGLWRVLAWTENRCRGFWRISVSKFQAVEYPTFRDAGAIKLSVVGGRAAISPVLIPSAEISTRMVHSRTPTSFPWSAYLLRECRAVRICLVLIKDQHSMLRTTLLVVVLKCPPQKKEIRRSAPLTLATDYSQHSIWLVNANLKQTSMLVSLPLSMCRLSVSHGAGGEGEEWPLFLFWVTPPAEAMAGISSQPALQRTMGSCRRELILWRTIRETAPQFSRCAMKLSLLMSAAKLASILF